MTRPSVELPAGFDDLLPFAAWSLPTETERNHKRISVTQAEIEAFSQAMLGRVDEIVTYLNGFPLDGMPPSAANLYYMLLSLAEVAPAIEFYGQPTVVDGFDSRRFAAEEDFVLRPRL